MRPVEYGGNAGIDCFQAPQQVAQVYVLGPVGGRQRPQHVLQVLHQRPVGGHSPERRFPEVAVGIHQTGHDDHARGINHLAICRGKGRADGGNGGAFQEYVCLGEVA
ncbi:MAG: hypothetical protein AVDCRST_MAG56-7376 [uncultured Cytophagales bacterium]|uniref:Uncharacterized protein n=1 Tax=uncultured Cytophagales bacterium TaxID=158755 RepID=A0A6J4LEW2_9SPHI|nr:MAG: hypothetical protein AVDCRST_MAG56-7376 [uncultured Cytophagales bacterium]